MNIRSDGSASLSYLALIVVVLSLVAAGCSNNEQDVRIDPGRGANSDKSGIGAQQSLPCVYTARPSEKHPTDELQQMQERGECATLQSDGSVTVHAEHLDELDFGNGIASVLVPGRGWYYVTPEGRTASIIDFDNGPDYFEEGLARTGRAGKIGFIDAGLAEVIAPQWDFAFPFHNGVAVVCQGCLASPIGDGEHSEMRGGVWGYIDRDGAEVVPVEFERDLLPEPPSPKPLTLAEQSLVVKSEGECADKCVRVELTWPVVQTAPSAATARELEQTLRQWYLAKLYSGESAETPEKLAQQLIEDFGDGKLRWTFTRSWQTEFRSAQVWTLKRIDEAHNFSSRPNIEWTRIQFSPVTGARINLSSYFDEAAMDRLNARAETRFRAEYFDDYHEQTGTDFYDVWSFDDNRFVVSSNFVVDADSIAFHWNQYQIGPGSFGSQTIRLKWTEVADLLRENAPVPGLTTKLTD